MTTMTATVTDASIASAIRDEHKAVQRDYVSAVQHAIKCGQLLNEAKIGQKHGQWHDWITSNFDFSHRTAQGYMRLARLDREKAQRVASLSLRQALKDIGEEFGLKQRRLERQVDRDLDQRLIPVRAIESAQRPASVVIAGVATRVADGPTTAPSAVRASIIEQRRCRTISPGRVITETVNAVVCANDALNLIAGKPLDLTKDAALALLPDLHAAIKSLEVIQNLLVEVTKQDDDMHRVPA